MKVKEDYLLREQIKVEKMIALYEVICDLSKCAVPLAQTQMDVIQKKIEEIKNERSD